MLVVGLTGGIGSGKTEVARLFSAHGVPIEDADAIAHAVVAPGQPGHAAIRATFGPAALRADGPVNRDWLRERAFHDPAFRRTLEGVLHPLIRAGLDAAMAAWPVEPYGVLVVPLLLEGDMHKRVDRVLVVDCPEDEQVRRVVARSGLDPDTVRRIMATQLPRSLRLARAHDVIDNGGVPSALEAQVSRLDRTYRELAAQPPRA